MENPVASDLLPGGYHRIGRRLYNALAMIYTVALARRSAESTEPFSIRWNQITPLDICNYHPHSSDHHPTVHARMIYERDAILIRFDVQDRYVRCVATDYQQPVCCDSCVEAFLEPVAGKGYFNFEFNAIGTLLTYYIEDPRRSDVGGFVKYTVLPADLLQKVQVAHDLQGPIAQEITAPTAWSLTARIPLSLMAHYVGPITLAPGSRWRGNFYKCGDRTSHPHWGSWSPIGENLNFHQPQRFGDLILA